MFLQIKKQKNYLLDGTTEDESIYNCICSALQKNIKYMISKTITNILK